MKLLSVDIGNSELKWGVFQDGVLQAVKRFASKPDALATLESELSLALTDLSASADGPLSGVVFCSVVPAAETLLRQSLHASAFLNTPILAVVPGHVQTTVQLGGYPPDQLGADRLVNVCAARALYQNRSFIVADFGTATTLDAVDKSGNYLGGVITPGIKSFASILSLKTAKLPETEATRPPAALGLNTQACLQSGIGIGYVGIIKELFARVEAEMGDTTPLRIATGGLAETYQTLSQGEPSFDFTDSTLTLQGLRVLFESSLVHS